MTKLVDAEGQIGGAAAAKDEKFEELKAARAELAKARSKVTDVAREATARVEEANDKLRDAETALAHLHLALVNQRLGLRDGLFALANLQRGFVGDVGRLAPGNLELRL